MYLHPATIRRIIFDRPFIFSTTEKANKKNPKKKSSRMIRMFFSCYDNTNPLTYTPINSKCTDLASLRFHKVHKAIKQFLFVLKLLLYESKEIEKNNEVEDEKNKRLFSIVCHLVMFVLDEQPKNAKINSGERVGW